MIVASPTRHLAKTSGSASRRARPGVDSLLRHARVLQKSGFPSESPAQVFRATLEANLGLHPLNDQSMFSKPGLFAQLHQGAQLPAAQRAQILATLWREAAHRITATRLTSIRSSVSTLTDLQSQAGQTVIRTPALDRARHDLVETLHTQDFIYLVAVLQKTFWNCVENLLVIDPEIQLQKTTPGSKRQTVLLENGARIFFHEPVEKTVDQLAEFQTLMVDMVEQFAKARTDSDFPAGPAYNRIQKNLVDLVRQVFEKTQKRLKQEKLTPLTLDPFFAGAAAPYTYPQTPAPSRLEGSMRKFRLAKVIHQGLIQMRALRLYRGEPVDLFTDFEQLRGTTAETQAGSLWDFLLATKPRKPMFELWYRRYVDRKAEALVRKLRRFTNATFLREYAKSPEKRRLWGFLHLEDRAFYTELRHAAGVLPNRAAGQTVRFQYGHGAKAMVEALPEALRSSPRTSIFASHKATSDEFILFEGLAASPLDKVLGGALSSAAIFARSDWDKNIWPFNVTNWSVDQEDLYDVLMIDEDPVGPLVALGAAIADGSLSWRQRSTILFPEGGRSFFFHNPPLKAGLGILANNSEIILPMGIGNSTGENLHGGPATLIAGRITRPQDWGLGDTLITSPKDAVRLVRRNRDRLDPLVEFVSSEIFLNTYDFSP